MERGDESRAEQSVASAAIRSLAAFASHGVALAAPAAHLAAYHNKGAQLIRPQSEGSGCEARGE